MNDELFVATEKKTGIRFEIEKVDGRRFYCEVACHVGGVRTDAPFHVKGRGTLPKYFCEKHFHSLYDMDPRSKEEYE